MTSPLVAKEKPKYQKLNTNSLNRKGRGHLSDHIVEQLREDLGLRVSGTAESRHSHSQQSASLQSHLAIRPNLMTTQSLSFFQRSRNVLERPLNISWLPNVRRRKNMTN